MGDGKCLIAEIFQGWISGMGCASHSDFQSERDNDVFSFPPPIKTGILMSESDIASIRTSEQDKMLGEGIIGINGEPYRIEGEPCGLCDGTGKAQKLSGFSPDEDCPLCDGTGLHIKWVKVQELRHKAGE